MMQHSSPMTASMPVLSRRGLIRLGFGATAVLTVAGGAAWLWRPGWRAGRLTESGRTIFRAVARAVLEGSLPSAGPAQESALDQHLVQLDATLAGLPRATQSEIAQLLGLLALAPARRWLTGLTADWPQATVGEIEAALRRMRTGDHALRQQAYHALRDLTNAAYYAQPRHWTLMGYPGPTAV